MSKIALAASVLIALSSCYSSDEPEPFFGFATLIIDTAEDPVFLRVDVAETDAQRERGPRDIGELGDDRGFVYVYFRPTRAPIERSDLTTSFSAAFFDADGHIVGFADLSPCAAAPCPAYEPDEPHVGALLVEEGAFERWGVRAGDEIQLTR